MQKIRLVLFAVAMLLSVTNYSQVITFLEHNQVVTIPIKDLTIGSPITSTKIRFNSTKFSAPIDINLSTAAFLTAANSEFISITSSAKQGIYSAGQVLIVNRQFIASVASSGSGSIVNFNGSSSVKVNESYSSLKSTLGTIPSGGSGTFTALSGDVVSTATGGATTIQPSVVTNAKMANMTASTFKGRITTTGAPQDLTAAQVKTALAIQDNEVVTNASLTIGSVTAAAGTSQSTINSTLNSEKVDIDLYSAKGVILSGSATPSVPASTSVGTDGQVLTANSATTSGLAWTTPSTGSAIQFQNQGTNTGTAGQATTYNFTGSGVSTAVASNIATVTINGGGVQSYSAGNGATVVATGAGVTFTRTTASVWTFAIPTGVRLLSFNIYSTNGENMGATSTLVFDYTGNTLTNQGATTAEPPTISLFQDGGGGMNQLVVGGSATSAFRPAISAVGSGDITLLSQSGSIASSGATIIKGQF